MISRTYVVKMPESVSTNPLNIFVRNSPGTKAVPITSGTDGKYYEWRGRPLRFEQLALTSAGAANSAFAPRARLGFLVTVTPIVAAISTDLPGVQLSASLTSLASTDSGPTIAIPALADDTTNGPMIRLIGGAGTAGKFFVVSLSVMEPNDEDRDPAGRR